MYIAVAGNIGAGKTTLAELLAGQLGFFVHYEAPENNPYIIDFYKDMNRWAFHMQIYLLSNRLNSILKIQESKKNVIQDRSFYEDAEIFAKALNQMNILSQRDYKTYTSLYENLKKMVQPPDLLIYLKASVATLVKHISEKKRPYESIRIDYLRTLNILYDKWFENYDLGKKILINVDELDFLENEDHLSEVFNQVNGAINGLFS